MKTILKPFQKIGFTILDNKESNEFGSITVHKEIRRHKDRVKIGNIQFYISGRMYGRQPKSFVYAMCYQKETVRPYRCKNSFEVEANKIYVSGKTKNEVVNKLIKEIQSDGNVFMSSTLIEEDIYLRMACLSFRSHLENVQLLIDIIREKISSLNQTHH